MLCTECQDLGCQTLVQLDETGKGERGPRGRQPRPRPTTRLSSRSSSTSTARKRSPSTKRPYHRAPLALHQHLHGAVGQAQDLDHVGQCPHRENVFRSARRSAHAARKEELLVVAARSDLAPGGAQRFLAAPRRAAPPCAGRPRCRAGQERNATNPGCLVVRYGDKGSPFCAASYGTKR